MLRHGDRVDVVLDCLPTDRDGELVEVVYVRLVTDGSVELPPVPEGGRRNVWGTWLGVQADAAGPAAFAIYRDGETPRRVEVGQGPAGVVIADSECPRCGAVVGNTVLHGRWHDAIDRLLAGTSGKDAGA